MRGKIFREKLYQKRDEISKKRIFFRTLKNKYTNTNTYTIYIHIQPPWCTGWPGLNSWRGRAEVWGKERRPAKERKGDQSCWEQRDGKEGEDCVPDPGGDGQTEGGAGSDSQGAEGDPQPTQGASEAGTGLPIFILSSYSPSHIHILSLFNYLFLTLTFSLSFLFLYIFFFLSISVSQPYP